MPAQRPQSSSRAVPLALTISLCATAPSDADAHEDPRADALIALASSMMGAPPHTVMRRHVARSTTAEQSLWRSDVPLLFFFGLAVVLPTTLMLGLALALHM